MPTSVSSVKTDHASRYLQQLCKHWSHKFTIEFNETAGKVPFNPETSLELAADASSLLMTLHVENPQDLDRMQNVVADHLKRFAFREELDVVWTADTSKV
ncbi:DUF2218 domain-containing protein [Agrobacterium sp. SHOUNA12C]|uniref:DUF2218 domain-containing protein n=2 Tax=Rhizobium rhizogenes TaxID=359 RepID=B9JG36_RHIR8|nr:MULTISPECIES: DUF2218 domain-containing protein [Rhizobium]ACM24819.1 conserved hypothetical protein [Rhizobium rhizogenes K84]KAA6482779.1 DUF2218 domain-containing protein [Agrobacterium sp. ICMP 7243]MCJ9722778.1 DUF2218 domain-containing protein [Agrobacterium sp. BETTINA12B]MCJ9757921.1 DUF2218 domain-containing protein [Agrobacterium sp. SHOUNA12C]OCI91519.1 hypothetical protein A6U85_24490 [Agrobacterium sp. 13-626]OCJ23926.1 hypothetical protein A6U88_26485 [Agrobacterium sp. B131/